MSAVRRPVSASLEIERGRSSTLGTRMLDIPLRYAYRAAHALLRLSWWLRRPETRGALAALWCDGKILVLRTTYRRAVSLPGGYVEPGESPARAVSREVEEEVGVRLEPGRFEHAYHGTKDFEFRKDTLDIFAATLEQRPVLRLRRAEIAWARWHDPEEVLSMPDVVPHLREYLESELRRRRG